jgi:hypothetical protein
MSRANKYEHLKKLIEAFSESYRDIVYHYTSADGISGIIDKHEIWMSNTAFMNDTTELKALEKATGIKDSDFTNAAVKEAWRSRNNWAEMTNYYMASFSKKRDSLEQWRAYGNFCVGFDAKRLAVRRRIHLYECLYTEDAIREWILAKEKIPEWDSLPDDEAQRNNAAYNLIYVASMKCKDSHFNAEEEVRLVATSHHNWSYPNSPGMYEDDLPIHFRPHRLYGFPVPYLKFFIERKSTSRPQGTEESETQMKERKLNEEAAKQRELLPITEVIVGPMAHRKEAKTACEILLSERGYKQATVELSEIPYRGI